MLVKNFADASIFGSHWLAFQGYLKLHNPHPTLFMLTAGRFYDTTLLQVVIYEETLSEHLTSCCT